MNIDKIEKMKTFPSFLNYIKINFKSSMEWMILILIMFAYFFSLTTAFIFIVVFSVFEYFIDKNIFSAFSKRREKNDTN